MEIWKEIAGYEGLYEISSTGRVRSLLKSKKSPANHVLKTKSSGSGYRAVALYRERKPTTRYVHHLVMQAFVGPCPAGCNTNHRNGDKSDNRLENLEYVTYSMNTVHAYRTGLLAKPDNVGSKNSNAKIDEATALNIKSMLDSGLRAMDIARSLSVSHYIVYDIKHRRKWTHLFEPESS